MAQAHAMAEAERNKHRSSNEIGTAEGNTIKAGQIRAATASESNRWTASKILPNVPVASTINNIKIVSTDRDLAGRYKTQGEIRDAKGNLLCDFSGGVAGSATALSKGLRYTEDILKTNPYDLLKKVKEVQYSANLD